MNSNSCLIPTPIEDVDGDQRWMSIVSLFFSYTIYTYKIYMCMKNANFY